MAEIADTYGHLVGPWDGGTAPPAGDPGGPALDVTAGLTLQLGRLADTLAAAQRRHDQVNANVWPFDLNPVGMAGNGTIDNPAAMSPNDGYCWDVRTLIAASFTSGQVAVYKNAPGDMALRYVFTSAGVWAPGSGNLMLRSTDRLVFVASGITGAVTIGGEVIMVANDYLGEYLL